VNAEFQWWLLILGIVIGGALVYLVLADVQGDELVDESLDEPFGETIADGAADASSATPAEPLSAGNVPDVEGHGPESEPAEAHPDQAGASHRGGHRAGVGEPLEGGR
jgi:hypothetical protein